MPLLGRARDRDYRGTLAKAARAHSLRTSGTPILILYDVTTPHFENNDDDDLRKVAMSKEHQRRPADPGSAARRSEWIPPLGQGSGAKAEPGG